MPTIGMWSRREPRGVENLLRCLGVVAILVGLSLGVSCSSDPHGSCVEVPGSCGGDLDCCSGRCDDGQCQCRATGFYCTTSTECCPGLACEGATPANPGTCGVAGGGCLPDGSVCTYMHECCSNFCGTGVCEPSRCAEAGEDCAFGSWCCDGLGCEGFDFLVSPGTCTATCGQSGDSCSRDDVCCSGFECDQGVERACVKTCGGLDAPCGDADDLPCCPHQTICKDGRCSACVPTSGFCTEDNQCCEGDYCGLNGGVRMCLCQTKGLACNEDRTCCFGLACVQGSCTCAEIGEPCGTTPCCDDRECFQGTCQYEACAPPKDPCSADGDCCNGECAGGECCTESGDSCSGDAQCCGELVCRDGTCTPCLENGATCDVLGTGGPCCEGSCTSGVCCLAIGAACAAGQSCCPTFLARTTCGSEGRCCVGLNEGCESESDCCAGRACDVTCCERSGQACALDTECCSRRCGNGSCCNDVGASCATGADCCTGQCTAGQCACASVGAACGVDADCCQPGGSLFPRCEGGACCLPPNSPCAGDAECCSGSCRNNGICD